MLERQRLGRSAVNTIAHLDAKIYPEVSYLVTLRMFTPRITLNHAVAFLGLILGLAVYCMMTRYQIPERIAFGSGILSVLVVAIFWTAINLLEDDDDD